MADNSSRDFVGEMDDWETLDENGELDKQINALKIKKKTQKESVTDSSQTNLEFGRVKILQNSEIRTQYTPTIKLLKREPSSSESVSQSSMGDRKPSYKSLQQREQEYAEARKRILGSAEEERNGSTAEESPTSSPLIAQRPILTSEKSITRQPTGPKEGAKGFLHKQTAVSTAPAAAD